MKKKLDILAIGVHPDDVELSCSGTLFHHIDLGYIVGICDLTQGELGTRGSAELRLKEAASAAQIMGVEVRENLGMADGFFENNENNVRKIAAIIRKYQPEIVMANAVSDRHPDHGRAAKLISDACFYAGLRKIEIEDELGEQLQAWRPRAIYHYIQDRNLKPDFVVDISSFIEKKMEAILAYSSQFYISGDAEPSTPISSKAFIDFIYAKNKAMGRDIGVEYAEGFNVERTIGIRDMMELI